METIEHLRSAATAFGKEPLLVSSDGQLIDLATGYIPLLVRFTFEDNAAKGLRKGKVETEATSPIYFSALELVRDHQVLLLSGCTGSGKTTFAKHLAFRLAAQNLIEPIRLVRNEDGGIHDERWNEPHTIPCYYHIDGPGTLGTFVNDTLPRLLTLAAQSELLIILDGLDNAADEAPVLLSKIVDALTAFDNVKLLLLGDASVVKPWILPSAIVRHDLLPLLEVQRRQAVSQLTKVVLSQVVVGSGAAAANPAYFALALEASHGGEKAEEVLDAWLAVIAPEKTSANKIISQAFDRLRDRSRQAAQEYIDFPTLFSSKAVQRLLAARYLHDLPLENAIEFYDSSPVEREPVLRSLLARLEATGSPENLLEGLTRGTGINTQLGALLGSDFVDESSNLRHQISSQMLAIVEESLLPTIQREKAGRVLSRLGDPRDLTVLANVPAGDFTLGSHCFPNSQPPETTSTGSFRIGLFPVINRDYSIFVRDTERTWRSPDGFVSERQNAPATDLTWYDAMAYCEWLTTRWRSSGKISPDEHVRLPTEPEWERASRGDQIPIEKGEPLYPWGTEWQHDSANYEESGFNTTCSVGLFPKGRSPCGCYDMAGQIWEWCSTLWGEDMATPSFQYPWRDDGREDLNAPGSIRRVLRGGCFSSGKLRIDCTYRGSLEPAGFWRGNGFRIVVAKGPQ